jgi:hypothetical protein
VIRHPREIAEENLLLLLGTGSLVLELDLDGEWSLVGLIEAFGVLLVPARSAESMRENLQLELLARMIVHGREFFEDAASALFDKCLEGSYLRLHEVREVY